MSALKTSMSFTLGAFLVLMPGAIARGSAIETLFGDMPGASALFAVLSKGPPQALFPNNVDCRDYHKTGYRRWTLRGEAAIDLGNWDGAFNIKGAISPRAFVKNGIDLYDVLESKCEVYAL